MARQSAERLSNEIARRESGFRHCGAETLKEAIKRGDARLGHEREDDPRQTLLPG